MLLLRCAACKNKLLRYDKIGQGEVLRCHKKRIAKHLKAEADTYGLWCSCGKKIGIDKGTYYKMIAKAFTYSGMKRNSG